ncbi:MAG: zinc-binding dehydrogenase [Candidatus Latescibacteria bacterium]|jgi:threonine dehydrogenase-like Zn-dependent dehydrogenase|nr:zinc-binding dehydrogenase [Candidatus Latescibacterota bacterium]MBT4137312.1 zinc-binding dehydrogenase [Candidatus Latescibacterota bacterium]
MKRVIKPKGVGRIEIEELSVPEIRQTEVLLRAERTLISRGSEIWRRYAREEAIDPKMMGYSFAGSVVQVGSRVDDLSMGERVAALAPHAEYVALEVTNSPHKPSVVSLPDSLSAEMATFWPLATSSTLWMQQTEAKADDTMVILGQGLVGSGCMQVAKALLGCRVIVVDALQLRCDLAKELGADEVIHAGECDPVEAVKELTGGKGADIVVEAVGGRQGAKAFVQAQDMLARGGLLQVLGLYEDEPLPLDSSKIQGKRLIGGYLDPTKRPEGSDRAIQLLMDGKIGIDQMITHRFHFEEAAEAFDLLYKRLDETMAVMLTWRE